jgi:hypothetical protein
VLHFLDDPQAALRGHSGLETRRAHPDRRFCAPRLEFLRSEHVIGGLDFPNTSAGLVQAGWAETGGGEIAGAAFRAETLTVMAVAETPGVHATQEGRGRSMSLQRLAGPRGQALSRLNFSAQTAEMETQLWNAIRRLAPCARILSRHLWRGRLTRDRTTPR